MGLRGQEGVCVCGWEIERECCWGSETYSYKVRERRRMKLEAGIFRPSDFCACLTSLKRKKNVSVGPCISRQQVRDFKPTSTFPREAEEAAKQQIVFFKFIMERFSDNFIT